MCTWIRMGRANVIRAMRQNFVVIAVKITSRLFCFSLKSTVFWKVTPCSLVDVCWRSLVVTHLAYFSALNIKAERSSETSDKFISD
jgi:hypothetical protein